MVTRNDDLEFGKIIKIYLENNENVKIGFLKKFTKEITNINYLILK
jgi:hypothetical protein